MKSYSNISSLILLMLFCTSIEIHAQVKLPRLISDGMVLQREANLKIWGWAANGEKVTISFLDSTFYTTANNNGEWSIKMSGLKAGGPYTMQINGSNSITIKNILVGDVWLCSGQSQIDINMERVSPLYPEEIKNAGNDEIRYFSVPVTFVFNEPQKDLPSGNWISITKDNILSVSAVAYFFADELYKKFKVPVGIIRSSLGGSPAEAWISENALKQFPVHYNEAQKFKKAGYVDSIKNADSERNKEWYTLLNQKDEGYKNPDLPWYKAETSISDWAQMEIPGYWADGELGNVNGVVWFRKDIDIPAAMAEKAAKLNLGTIVDADSVFVNGTYVGSTGYMYPPRRYKVPAGLLKEGKNTVVIRVINNGGRGGFVPNKPYELIIEDQIIDLKGKWAYRLGAKMEPLRPETFIRWKPTGLHNAMLAPLKDFTIKGAVWYQGESNSDRPAEYAKLLPALITNWRKTWGYDFPFLLVQLHNFMRSYDYPTQSNWALTRESQAKALALPKTGMAVAIDLGEWNDIHPLNKKDVAKRLVLAAQKVAYGDNNVIYSGPTLQSSKVSGNRIVLTFTNIGSGLLAKDGSELKHFAIAGEDKKFVWANAKIEGNKVIVSSEKVKKPVAVRYAWADNPEGANLYNKEGLPASPFRTDAWE